MSTFADDVEQTDEQWERRQMEFEEAEANRIVIDLNPRKWHPLVVPFRDELEKNAATLIREFKEHQRRSAKPFREPELNYFGVHLHEYEQHGLSLTFRAYPLRVYFGSYQRALAILNGLLFEAQKRGFTADYDAHAGRFLITWNEASVSVRMTVQKVLKFGVDIETLGEIDRLLETKIPTNMLKLCLGRNGRNEWQIADDPDVPLERKINKAFIQSYRLILIERIALRKRDLERRQHEQAMAAMLALEAERKEKSGWSRKNENGRSSFLKKPQTGSVLKISGNMSLTWP